MDPAAAVCTLKQRTIDENRVNLSPKEEERKKHTWTEANCPKSFQDDVATSQGDAERNRFGPSGFPRR